MNAPILPPPARAFLAGLVFLGVSSLHADPLLSSWFTSYSAKYARIYTSDANKTAGTSVTTWTNGSQTQSTPAYCGVQQVDYSTSWVYIKTTGLASHIMGPWLNGSFPNLPKNQNTTYRFPRTTANPATKTLTGGGSIGYFVDGVAMFDSRDAFYWNGSADTAGVGSWNRDAWVNESATFDAAKAHQEGSGTYHYHANPIALRYLLGDHVDYNTSTKTYSESAASATKHSPLLGFVRDGYPVYGPYGYATATDASSGVTRMRSGYQLRDGSNGSDNLTSTGRTAIPAWATRLGYTAGTGPSVSTSYPLGRYMEDNAYLGDLGKTQGVDFDLDEYNGRYCVTPEYPGGVYAYFVAINADGSPKFPYNIGRAFRGSPTGSATSISETVTTYTKAGPSTQEQMSAPAVNATTGDVTLTWNSVEGGTYTMEASTDLSTWTTLSSSLTAASGSVATSTIDTAAASGVPRKFYRVTRTALASYDGSSSGSGTSIAAPGGSATRGTTVTVTITLPTSPPLPPATVVPQSITLAGTITGTAISRPSQATAQATFTIPAGAATGAQNIVVVFSPGPTYTLTGALTIN